MTPKEKAYELHEAMYQANPISVDAAKRCAIIAVDEIIDNDKWREDLYADELGGVFGSGVKYWNYVKTEIEAI